VNQTVMIVRYLRLTVWPTALVINYGHPLALTLAQVWPQALAVSALLLLAIVALVYTPAVGFLGAWMFLTLAPASSLIPIATEVGAERRMYLPTMALVACAVLAMDRLLVGKRFGSPAFGTALPALAAALAMLTFARNSEYASALMLAQTALARWPSAVAHGMVGAELAALGRDDEALPELRAAALSDPRARYNFGITLFNRKDYTRGDSRAGNSRAGISSLREEVPLARRAIGNAHALQRQWPEAILQYRLALSMVPSDQATRRLLIDTLTNQGMVLASAGRLADAIATFRQAVNLDSTNVMASHKSRQCAVRERGHCGRARRGAADARCRSSRCRLVRSHRTRIGSAGPIRRRRGTAAAGATAQPERPRDSG
jgi:tetratricopeptide (TPR) repeat protein